MEHCFTLILAGVSELTPELADAVYEATGGDIELNMRGGVAYIEFQREGDSLHAIILKAIGQVQSADPSLRVVRVESPVANAIAKINAELLGIPAA
jgi:hypothetical protein